MNEVTEIDRRIQWYHWLLLVPVIGYFLWLRVPLLGEYICDTDLAGMIYSGWGMADGLLPYRDIFETKPPGTYFLFALMIKIFGMSILPIHVLAIFWTLVALVVLFILTSRLTDPKGGLVAAAAFAMTGALDFMNGLCPNYEVWAVTPGLLGLLFYHIGIKSPRPWLPMLGSGLMLGLSMSMKFQGLFFAVAVGIALFSRVPPLGKLHLKRAIISGLWIGLGIGSVWLFYLAYYAMQGAAGDLLAAISPSQGADYAKSKQIALYSFAFLRNLRHLIFEVPVLFVGMGGAIAALVIQVLRKSARASELVLLFSWWLMTFFAVFFLKGLISDGMFYNHYLILAFPGFCAIFGYTASVLLSIARPFRAGAYLVVGVALVQLFLSQFWEFQMAGESYSCRQKTGQVADSKLLFTYRDMELMYGVGTAKHMETAAEYIQLHTDPEDTIFIWDPITSLYILSKRRSAVYYYKPYFSSTTLPWSVHSEGDLELMEIRKRIIDELTADPPKFVIHLTQSLAEYPHKEPLFRELERFLRDNYVVDDFASDGAFTFWRHRDSGSTPNNEAQ